MAIGGYGTEKRRWQHIMLEVNKMTYDERQQQKAEHYQEKAERLRAQSESAYNASSRLAESIPFGQPILVGHHSEGRHRRDIDRIHNSMNKSIELSKQAESAEQKAQNALNPNFISSDDENAITKLKEKLATLEAKHIELKAIPKEKREWYVLPYSKAEIKRIKDRITTIEATRAMPEINKEINGIIMKTDKDENRLRLIFPGKPSEEIRTKLKQSGFVWSPFNSAWQRKISNGAIYDAERILNEVK